MTFDKKSIRLKIKNDKTFIQNLFTIFLLDPKIFINFQYKIIEK